MLIYIIIIMEDFSNFTRNSEVGSMLLRPHNTNLNAMVVPSSEYNPNNSNADTITDRVSNPNVRQEFNKNYNAPFMDREPNSAIIGGSLEGGKFGRGMRKLRNTFKDIGSVAKTVAPLIPLVL